MQAQPRRRPLGESRGANANSGAKSLAKICLKSGVTKTTDSTGNVCDKPFVKRRGRKITNNRAGHKKWNVNVPKKVVGWVANSTRSTSFDKGRGFCEITNNKIDQKKSNSNVVKKHASSANNNNTSFVKGRGVCDVMNSKAGHKKLNANVLKKVVGSVANNSTLFDKGHGFREIIDNKPDHKKFKANISKKAAGSLTRNASPTFDPLDGALIKADEKYEKCSKKSGSTEPEVGIGDEGKFNNLDSDFGKLMWASPTFDPLDGALINLNLDCGYLMWDSSRRVFDTIRDGDEDPIEKMRGFEWEKSINEFNLDPPNLGLDDCDLQQFISANEIELLEPKEDTDFEPSPFDPL